MTAFDFTGQVVIVSGGSRGIGRSIALAFADAGAQVVVSSRKQEAVDDVVRTIKDRGGEALGVAAHVGEEEAVTRLIESAVGAFAGVDIVVNNAGTNPHFGPLVTATTSLWDKIMEVNVRGAFFVCRQVTPIMQERGGGKIINMASIAGITPQPAMGLYSISKAGVIMLTKALAQELGQFNIQVNALAPGIIKTRFSRVLWQTPSIARAIEGHTPLGRMGEVDDVVGAALYLASPLSNYVTGEVLVVDGGMNVGGAIG